VARRRVNSPATIVGRYKGHRQNWRRALLPQSGNVTREARWRIWPNR
jgi:hypothetical protein